MRQRFFVTFLMQFKCHYNKTSSCINKKVSTDRNHLSRRKLRSRAGGVRRAETKCEICVGAYFPGHQVAMDVTCVTWPRVTVPFNRWLGDRGIVGKCHGQCTEPAACT